jgi:hypothetical protein
LRDQLSTVRIPVLARTSFIAQGQRKWPFVSRGEIKSFEKFSNVLEGYAPDRIRTCDLRVGIAVLLGALELIRNLTPFPLSYGRV